MEQRSFAFLLNCLFHWIFPVTARVPAKRESLRAFDWKRANPFGAFKFLIRHPEIGNLAFGFFTSHLSCCPGCPGANWTFFAKYRFHWSDGMNYISLIVVGVLIGGVQGEG